MSFCTREWLEERCYRDADTGCLIWRGQVDRYGAPIAWTPMDGNGKRSKIMVRRGAWEAKNGRPVPEGMKITSSCGNPRCVQCLEVVTPAEVIRRQWARTDIRVKRMAATTAASRRRGKLDLEKAREIRNSSDRLKDVAERHGISMTLASQVRRGLAWKEPANPFAGLGGRSA